MKKPYFQQKTAPHYFDALEAAYRLACRAFIFSRAFFGIIMGDGVDVENNQFNHVFNLVNQFDDAK